MPPQLTPEQEAQEDQKCQSDGYQINTPAYDYCRGEWPNSGPVAAGPGAFRRSARTGKAA